MAFEKGVSGNPEGRPLGSKNKTTKEIQEKISLFLINNIDKLQNEYDNLSSTDKLKFVINLLQYSIPKMKDSEEQEISAPGKTGFLAILNQQYVARKFGTERK